MMDQAINLEEEENESIGRQRRRRRTLNRFEEQNPFSFVGTDSSRTKKLVLPIKTEAIKEKMAQKRTVTCKKSEENPNAD
jgi:hypothetical protein